MPQNLLNIRTTEAPIFAELKEDGYSVSELYLDGYFDGFSATKQINGKTVEVYVGSDNGDLYFTPQAYVDDEWIGEARTPEKAARVASFRAMLQAKSIKNETRK